MYELYEAITILELQAYMMMQCSYMLLDVYQRSYNTIKAAALSKSFEQKIVESLQVSYEIFKHADRTFHKCDPDEYVEGSTFLQITRLLQGHIENEIDLNRERTCRDTCSAYQLADDFGCSERSICRKQTKCHGKLYSCWMLQDDMWICPGKKDSSRRYEFIEYNNGKVLGEKKSCSTNGFSVIFFAMFD